MHLFKTSAETFESVIKNEKHAFRGKPKDLHAGDVILISKNLTHDSGIVKQISYYAILDKIVSASFHDIERFWPGNGGRWNYITEFMKVIKIDTPFNLNDVLPKEYLNEYRGVQTHKKIPKEHEKLIWSSIKQKPEKTKIQNSIDSLLEKLQKFKGSCDDIVEMLTTIYDDEDNKLELELINISLTRLRLDVEEACLLNKFTNDE
ncbi:MAG: hypothetical protein WCT23_04290 [Candidatus Neomarinimicrobiota bacterium]|jgi:hypothetical protein